MSGFPSSPTAPVALVQSLAHQVNPTDIESLLQCQKHMMLRFEKTNEMLVNCNSLSTARFEVASRELRRHTHHLQDMKKDLDSVFRRIRFLKMRLAQQYPASFSACARQNVCQNVLNEEEEQEEKQAVSLPVPVASSSESSSSGRSLPTSPSSSDDVG